MLEYPEKMCEYCCNFDKEHIGMDGTALCKLTMTLAYSEDYGGNCMFYNVPKEQIFVPPCKVGQTLWFIKWYTEGKLHKPISRKVIYFSFKDNDVVIHFRDGACDSHCIGECAFLTKEEAEKALAERRGE